MTMSVPKAVSFSTKFIDAPVSSRETVWMLNSLPSRCYANIRRNQYAQKYYDAEAVDDNWRTTSRTSSPWMRIVNIVEPKIRCKRKQNKMGGGEEENKAVTLDPTCCNHSLIVHACEFLKPTIEQAELILKYGEKKQQCSLGSHKSSNGNAAYLFSEIYR